MWEFFIVKFFSQFLNEASIDIFISELEFTLATGNTSPDHSRVQDKRLVRREGMCPCHTVQLSAAMNVVHGTSFTNEMVMISSLSSLPFLSVLAESCMTDGNNKKRKVKFETLFLCWH
jgi:hypothetical protein